MLARVLPAAFPPVTRRSLLAGTASLPLLLAASACTSDPPAALPPDPDRAALDAARDVEAELLDSLAGWSEPGMLLDKRTTSEVLAAHLAALDTALGSSPAPSPSSSSFDSDQLSQSMPAAIPTSTAVALVDAAARDHTRALRSASAAISPLLASIAASDAALAGALRRGRA